MNKLKEEFMKFCFWQGKLTGKESKEFFNWINQNYISKEEILGLECLKEEHALVKSEYPEVGKLSFDFTQFDKAISNNQLRNEIKEEIKKLMNKGSRRCWSLHNSSKGEATANVHLEDKSYTIAEVNDIIDEMWLDKEKTRYDVGWNSALAELEAKVKILKLKPKDKLGDDFTKFLESEGYEVIDCKPEDTL